MTSEIVTLKDGQPVTTSVIVADVFGKQHPHVVRDIDRIISTETYQRRGVSNFGETPYIHPQNGQTYRMFTMDRQGFEILAMGFTGEKALEWKLKYSDAFAAMEAALRQQFTVALPNFSNPAESARAWALEYERAESECAAKEAERMAKEAAHLRLNSCVPPKRSTIRLWARMNCGI